MRSLDTVRRTRVLTGVALIVLATLLSGCVRVSTVISSRGFIQREFAVTVDSANKKAVQQRLREVFRGWDIRHKDDNVKVTFICKTTKDTDTPADHPGLSLEMESRGPERLYRYAETIRAEQYLGGEDSTTVFHDTAIELRITMPGEIVSKPRYAKIDPDNENTVVIEAALRDLDGTTIKIESLQTRTDKAFLIAMLVVLIGGAIVSFASSDAPRRLIDRFFGEDDAVSEAGA